MSLSPQHTKPLALSCGPPNYKVNRAQINTNPSQIFKPLPESYGSSGLVTPPGAERREESFLFGDIKVPAWLMLGGV